VAVKAVNGMFPCME